jgi:hypothetical protein
MVNRTNKYLSKSNQNDNQILVWMTVKTKTYQMPTKTATNSGMDDRKGKNLSNAYQNSNLMTAWCISRE